MDCVAEKRTSGTVFVRQEFNSYRVNTGRRKRFGDGLSTTTVEKFQFASVDIDDMMAKVLGINLGYEKIGD